MTNRMHGPVVDNNDSTPEGAAGVPVVFDDSRGWRSCWGRFQCFTIRRREKYRRAATQLVAGPVTLQSHIQNGGFVLDVLNQAAALSPVMHVPPSSPASFLYSDNPSSVPSPAAFLTLCPIQSGNECGQAGLQIDSVGTDAAGGSFCVDAVLVTPPIYSALTTAPATPLSTAPFTPPPELAHLTTPPSPEVPFAELLASSLNKCSLPEQDSERQPLRYSPPSNLELAYRLYPGSPTGQLVSPRSGASSTGTSSPLPERVSFLENQATTVASTPFTSIFKNASFIGLGNVTLTNICHVNAAEGLQQDSEDTQKCQHGQSGSGTDEINDKCHRGAGCSHSLSDKNMEQSLYPVASGIQTKNFDRADRESKCDEHCLGSHQESSLESLFEQSKISVQASIERFNDGSKHLTNTNTEISDIDELDECKDIQDFQENRLYSSCATLNRSLEKSAKSGCRESYQPEIGGNGACCSTCGELTSKCTALSEALQQTKEKLILIERRQNLIDDRERKCKQLIQWMQLGAKLQQESIFRLSKELSWQEAAFLDLQAQHLAGLGIELPDTSRELSSTELL